MIAAWADFLGKEKVGTVVEAVIVEEGVEAGAVGEGEVGVEAEAVEHLLPAALVAGEGLEVETWQTCQPCQCQKAGNSGQNQR